MPVAVRFGPHVLANLSTDLGAEPCIVLAFEPAGRLGLEAAWRLRLGERLRAWITVPEGLASLAHARGLSSRLWPALEDSPQAVLIGLGGGSVLDQAKMLRFRPPDGDFEALTSALKGLQPWPEVRRSRLWLVPTTAGTGSEVTRWATLWDTDSDPACKLSFDESFGWADRAYVDPALSATAPIGVTRDCALDALAHALESIWNVHANPVSDGLALSAARQVIGALPDALDDPGDLGLRRELALAALNAGLAFSQTRTALAHALSYSLTLELGIPHGQACAIWLPACWRQSLGIHSRVDRLLGQVFRCGAHEGVERLEDWLRLVGIDPDPSAHGIQDAASCLARAMSSARGRNFIKRLDLEGQEAT